MYHNQKAACGTYQKNELANLNPGQIVARLYQALEQSLKSSCNTLTAGEAGPQGEQLGRALAIIGELQAALNMEEGGEIAANLNDLYSFLTVEISQANISRDATRLNNAIKTVAPLTEAWVELASRPKKVEVARVGGRPIEGSRSVAFQATF